MKQIAAGAFGPFAVDGRLFSCRYGPASLKTPEVVEPNDIQLLERPLEAGDPPGVAILRHHIPTVQRVAPQLAGRAEVVRRDPGNQSWLALSVEVEEICVRPGVGTVVGHEDRDIADDADATLVGVRFQAGPLSVELVLRVLVERDQVLQSHAPVFERTRLARGDVLLPFIPTRPSVVILECGKESVVI